jgi:hypothetical protein
MFQSQPTFLSISFLHSSTLKITPVFRRSYFNRNFYAKSTDGKSPYDLDGTVNKSQTVHEN